MKKDIRMIALDLDGTSLNSKKEISPAVKEAIVKACAKGIFVLPATGRQYTGIPQEFLRIPGIKYALSSNGACVKNIETGEKVYTDCIKQPLALDILKLARKNNVAVSIYVDGKGYVESQNYLDYAEVLPPAILEYITNSRECVPDLERIILEGPLEPEKFTFIFASQKLRTEFGQSLKEVGNNTTTSSLGFNLETNSATASKGNAILWLAAKLGINKEQIMAVGDAPNDMEMLKAVGYSVAMGNAEPEIKAIADAITKSCDEDGVAHAINGIL